MDEITLFLIILSVIGFLIPILVRRRQLDTSAHFFALATAIMGAAAVIQDGTMDGYTMSMFLILELMFLAFAALRMLGGDN